MKNDLYWKAIKWIALNDDPCEEDELEIQGTITVMLVSELFKIPCKEIAKDILLKRK